MLLLYTPHQHVAHDKAQCVPEFNILGSVDDTTLQVKTVQAAFPRKKKQPKPKQPRVVYVTDSSDE